MTDAAIVRSAQTGTGRATKVLQQAGRLISEEIYIFLLSGNEQILINVKTAISHLPARFFILILFVPLTQEMKIFFAVRVATVSPNPPPGRPAPPPPSPRCW